MEEIARYGDGECVWDDIPSMSIHKSEKEEYTFYLQTDKLKIECKLPPVIVKDLISATNIFRRTDPTEDEEIKEAYKVMYESQINKLAWLASETIKDLASNVIRSKK